MELGDGLPRRSRIHYFPITLPLLALLFVVILILIVLIQVGAISYAYERIGIPPHLAGALLLLSLLGSYVNIPVAVLEAESVISEREVNFFGARWIVPVAEERPRTVLAVNVGGAVIPTIVTIELLLRHGFLGKAAIATAIVAAVVHRFARPLEGIGIAVPTFIPPVIAALAAFALSRDAAPALAYCAGTLGTLIGGDLLNLRRIRGLGAPVASIGGAGTFDGIFLTGILAVLLA